MPRRFGRLTAGCGPWLCAVVFAASATAGSGETTAAAGTGDWQWPLPAWLPPPPVPDDNPMSTAKVTLGRHLFYDSRLSRDGTVACASCHVQSLGFSDGRALGIGVDDTPTRRNSMSLANVAYSPVLTWSNPHLTSLEFQALIPLFGEQPVEMGNAGREDVLFSWLNHDPDYAPMFAAAFPERQGKADLFTLTRALAAFQRTLISVGSDYDRYQYGGETDALSDSAKRGLELFFSHTHECYHCHQGFNFTDSLATSRNRFIETPFHNTGLYNIDGRGDYPTDAQGLIEFSGRNEDMGRFRTQGLRNVAVTAPYFHDGSAATLDDVLEHYAAGGRQIHTGERAGNGSASPLKSALLVGFPLGDRDRADLLAFLESLTDPAFLTDPAHADPWPTGHAASRQRRLAGMLPTTGLAPDITRRAYVPLAIGALLCIGLFAAWRNRPYN